MRDAKRVMLRRPEADIAHAEGGLGRAIRRELEAEPGIEPRSTALQAAA